VFEAVHMRDVRMVERREQLRLAFEADQPVLVGRQGGRQHLDRDAATEPGVGRPIDLSHAAFAELGGNLVGPQTETWRKSHLSLRELPVVGPTISHLARIIGHLVTAQVWSSWTAPSGRRCPRRLRNER
jgi:hypothetical protein